MSTSLIRLLERLMLCRWMTFAACGSILGLMLPGCEPTIEDLHEAEVEVIEARNDLEEAEVEASEREAKVARDAHEMRTEAREELEDAEAELKDVKEELKEKEAETVPSPNPSTN